MSKATSRTTLPPVLIVAGGSGARLGTSIPKAYLPLRGASLLEHSIRSFAARLPPERIVCAALPAHKSYAASSLNAWRGVRAVEAGQERAISVLNGLRKMLEWFPESPGFLIHDACRPFVPPALLDRIFAAAQTGVDCVVPVMDITDSVKVRSANGLTSGGDRSQLQAAQTPQFLSSWAARSAVTRFQSLTSEQARAFTDEASIAEALQFSVVGVPGAPECAKLTYYDDIPKLTAIFDALCPGVAPERMTAQGVDAHAFAPSESKDASFPFCGIRVPFTKIVAGHSDGDVALHALTDAVLGAFSGLDIGRHFPDTDPKWKGADSTLFLKEALRLAAAQDYVPETADVTAICQNPRLSPYVPAARNKLAEILFGSSIYAPRVSVKATSTDGLGFTGRGEGLACMATVTLVRSGSRSMFRPIS